MSRSIARSSPYRFVSYFYNQYRVSVPVKTEEGYKQIYVPTDTSLDDIRTLIIQEMKEGGQSKAEIAILMEGWPNKINKAGKTIRRHTQAYKDNQSGYLGVNIYPNLKSVRYTASSYENGQIKTGKSFLIRLNEFVKDEIYWLDRNELKNYFTKCCRSADTLRRRTPRRKEEYAKHYKDVDWQTLVNRLREQRIDSDSALQIHIVDSLGEMHEKMKGS